MKRVKREAMGKTWHELREWIVRAIAANEQGYMSPKELEKLYVEETQLKGAELKKMLSQVSYHVKVLKDEKAIWLFKTEPRRGAVEHYYKVADHVWDHDNEALDQIAETLGGKVPKGDELLSAIAQAVSETGRKVKGFRPKKSSSK